MMIVRWAETISHSIRTTTCYSSSSYQEVLCYWDGQQLDRITRLIIQYSEHSVEMVDLSESDFVSIGDSTRQAQCELDGNFSRFDQNFRFSNDSELGSVRF